MQAARATGLAGRSTSDTRPAQGKGAWAGLGCGHLALLLASRKTSLSLLISLVDAQRCVRRAQRAARQPELQRLVENLWQLGCFDQRVPSLESLRWNRGRSKLRATRALAVLSLEPFCFATGTICDSSSQGLRLGETRKIASYPHHQKQQWR